MLSYRHSFHAGSYADVIKHIVLVEIFEHLRQKDSAFDYVDTHAGAGLFDLQSSEARKLAEYANGIGRLRAADFPELASYFEVVSFYNQPGKLDFYPGSPAIARYFLRSQDRAWLYELHPRDYESLAAFIGRHRKIRVARADGLRALTSVLPPKSRRACVLIDPSYELKSDYEDVFDAFKAAWLKFPSGIYAIWYPAVERRKIEQMQRKFVSGGIRDVQRFELGIAPDSSERGMTAAGLFVVNPPWKLFEKMSTLLPRLAKSLASDHVQHYKCDVITAE